MRLHPTRFFFSWLLIIVFPIFTTSAQDSSDLRPSNKLVADMARLIRRNAHFTGTTMAFKFDAYADTTVGLKLYVGEQINMLGNISDKQWYYIDFEQPIKANQFRIVRRKKYFVIDASRQITKKIKVRKNNGEQHERNARLLIPVLDWRGRRKITANYEQLYTQLTIIIRQLVDD